MKWSSLNKIYNGLIGKVFILISLLSSIALVPILKEIESLNIAIILIGSLFILIGYIVNLIYIPEIIKNFAINEYLEHNLLREKEGYLNKPDEFSIFEDKVSDINNLYIFKDKAFSLKKFTSLKDAENIDGNSSIYSLSMIKYAYINTLNTCIRCALTIILITGICCIYYPLINRTIKLIVQGLS